MKKIFIPVLCAALAFSSAASASDLSDWAVSEYDAANSAGLIPYSIVSDRLTDSVTRAEFCEAVMNLYMIMKGEAVELTENPFVDTDNVAVRMAYTLGVIDGKTETEFFPDDPIKRQEMAKIIMRTINAADKDAHVTMEELEKLIVFEDFGETDDWAATDIAKSIKYEIINGVSKTTLQPKGYATREQAIAIINRAFEAFADDKMFYEQPEITDLYDGITLSDSFAFNWTAIGDAKEYIIIIKDAGYDFEASFTSKTNKIDISGKGLDYNKNYTVLVGAKMSDYVTVFSDPVDVYYGTDREVTDVITSLEDKYNRVFPGGVPFATQSDADYNMQTVSFPVWKLGESGEKYSSTMWVMVNRNLADEVVKIFTEIYKAPEKFPIKDVGGYSWRTTAFGSVSHHSYGTCIDINFDENYYCYPSGQAITGSFWRPYDNPFSIPADGSVVKAFSKYGWTWGGNWTSLKDYMHFSYLGK
ncbi:MAG: M15 family metallopeptidase [Clostridia bacterium]|nr:M15 family metallopeptidase [Clostridia bacterium]